MKRNSMEPRTREGRRSVLGATARACAGNIPRFMSAAPADRPPLSPRHWLSWLGIGALVLLARLPSRVQRGLGALLGAILFQVLRGRRRFAARNLALCFPELDAAARATLLRRNFRSLGRGTFEFMRAWWGPLGALERRSSITGIEHLERANAEGRG